MCEALPSDGVPQVTGQQKTPAVAGVPVGCPRGRQGTTALRYTVRPAGQRGDTDRGPSLEGDASPEACGFGGDRARRYQPLRTRASWSAIQTSAWISRRAHAVASASSPTRLVAARSIPSSPLLRARTGRVHDRGARHASSRSIQIAPPSWPWTALRG